MPVEVTDNSESRCPVRRSGRQPKRTDKLEEFLLTTKRGTRRSAPPSIESGDPPSQTPTDAETASEASFDGDAAVSDDKVDYPERRTRSSTRSQTQMKTRGGRLTRGRSRAAAKDDGSSENEDEGRNAVKKEISKEDQDTEGEPSSEEGNDASQTVLEKDSEKNEAAGEKNQCETDTDKDEVKVEPDEQASAAATPSKRGPIKTYINKKRVLRNTTPAAASPAAAETKLRANQSAAKTRKPQAQDEEDDEEDDDDDSSTSSSSSSTESDDGGYDPNALYCICRQKHNKRFMICCDRCEEWFHGDCVGITEARGRLMERNGEDYVCPNCTAKKNQVVRPATSFLPANAEVGKPKPDAAFAGSAAASSAVTPTTTEKTNTSGAESGLSAVQVVAAALASAGHEEKASEDMGIKGRIEKATNPTGKKKIKIFQPAVQQPPGPKADLKSAATAEKKAASSSDQRAAADAEPKIASNVEVKTSPGEVAEEESSLPKCIGPGCNNNAQPDSVYCGNDCILRHAAAAMKSITDVKEPQQKTNAQKNKSTHQRSDAGGKRAQKTAQEESDSEEDQSPDPDEDDEDEHAVEQPPPPATASWSSDHNYIAVTPEKTTPISSSVLNKKSSPREEKPSEKEQKEKDPTPPPGRPSLRSSSQAKGNKKPPAVKPAKISPKGKKPPPQAAPSKTSPKKPASASTANAVKSKKSTSAPGHKSSPFPSGPIHATGALRVQKSNFTIPKKQPQPKESSSNSQSSSSSRVPSSPVSSAPPSHSSSSRPPHPAVSAPHVPPMPPPHNKQMRTNIRRSLTDILYKRVSDSDDLKMTENEVAKLAFAIEKEMFNLCLSTDSKYKNKYRSLMFNLKDPKNKGLFYRVIGGEVSPFRLVRLSAEELLSKEISEWKKPEAAETQSPGSRVHSGQSKMGNRHDSSSHSVDTDDAPPTSDADVCITGTTSSSHSASATDQDDSGAIPSVQSSTEPKSGNSMPDIFSSMLKDTTSEHKAHLFDLNCKICTGQKMEDEPGAKKARVAKKPESKPSGQDSLSSRSEDVSHLSHSLASAAHQHQEPSAHQTSASASYQSGVEPAVPESQPQLYREDLNMMIPPAQAPAPVAAAVSSVTISRRDPRMARHSSAVTVSFTAPEKPASTAAETPPAPVTTSLEVAPKGPLPLPPAPPPPAPIAKLSKSSTSEPPPEGETAIFLHGQEKIWKGFINMPLVAKFVTKAYLVSGSFEYLKEDLPDTIQVGGRIPPNTVWDYVGKLKTSLSKELCLIRFHPATEEEEVAYVSLFSYFSSRKRFGVVEKNNRRIKDLYLIPLGSKDPLPSKLLPFDGPGLEPARPNLLLGLLICQKDRKRSGPPIEMEDKRSRIQTTDADETGLPKAPLSLKAERSSRQSLEIPFSTTPPGSPPPSSSEISSSTVGTASVLSLLSSIKAPASSATTGKDSPTSSSSMASSAANASPLQTILKTLFWKKNSDASNSPSDQGAEQSAPTSTLLDPIVRQFAQISKETSVDEDEDDRPYDPEEEYDPSRGYNEPKRSSETITKAAVSQPPEVGVSEADDVAYDPEDDSIFEEVKMIVPGQIKTAPESISDPQKILESLKQIGNQTSQKQGEQQVSSTQPTKSLLVNTQLLQLGKKVEELVKSSSVAPIISQRRDPRQTRDPRQADDSRKSSEEKDEPSVLSTEPVSLSQPVVEESKLPDIAEVAEVSKDMETPLTQEEKKSETSLFLDSDKTEVSIPLLGEEVDPDMEVNYMDEQEVKAEKDKPVEAETELDKYSIWPNAASILKVAEDSEYRENSQNTPAKSYFNEPTNTSTVTSTIPVLAQSAIADTHSHHMTHQMSASGFDNEYRPTVDIPSQSNFPPSHSMQGQNLIMRPPLASMVPRMQALPPMSAPVSMQGPPPPMRVPLPGHGRPPMHGDGSQQYGALPSSYTPYQNQWPGNQPQLQQQQPPGPSPQNIVPPRGPPPFSPMAQRGPPPQMFEPSIPPQHIGQQGPHPGLPLPPNMAGQANLPPPRFGSPLPPFNFPANRGPPPPFTALPPGHFDNKLPPPTLFPGSRGPPPSLYGDHGTRPPMIDQPRGLADQYNKDSPNISMQMNMDHNPNAPHIFKDGQGDPPGQIYRVPLPNQYEERRGPPHNQYGGSRLSSSPPHRGLYEEHRGLLPQENRPLSSQPFRGSEVYRFDRLSDENRPVRHSGPLLPTPTDSPLGPPSRIGTHGSDLHREDRWHRHSPEMRRRSSSTREDSEPRSGERFSRFEVGNRESGPGSLQPSEERQREVSEDRHREKEREAPHGGRPSWDRGQGTRWSREREWDRGRERERERDQERSRERDRSRGRDSERRREGEGERRREAEGERRREGESERPRETEGERRRETEGERRRETEGERRRETEGERRRETEGERRRETEGERRRETEGERRRETEVERIKDQDTDKRRDNRDRDRERERDRTRDSDRRDSDRDRARNRDRDRERDRDRKRDRSRSRDRDRGKDRGRDRDRDRDREKERDRDKDRERDRDRNRDKEKERERDRDKNKDRREKSKSKEKKEEKKDHNHDTHKESGKPAENVKKDS